MAMAVERFEQLIVWQKSKQLCINIYNNTCDFRDYGFRDQIQKASVSIMNNIAEGFERKSNKEFSHFLYVAKGSCGDVRSMLILSQSLPGMGFKDHEKLIADCEEVSKLIYGLIRKL